MIEMEVKDQSLNRACFLITEDILNISYFKHKHEESLMPEREYYYNFDSP